MQTHFFMFCRRKDHLSPTAPQKPFPSGWLRGSAESHRSLLCQYTSPRELWHEMTEAWVPEPFNGKVAGLPRVRGKQDTSQSQEWGSVQHRILGLLKKKWITEQNQGFVRKGMGTLTLLSEFLRPAIRVLAQSDLLQIGCSLYTFFLFKWIILPMETNMGFPQNGKIKNHHMIQH